jgi:osmoprotectant transport system permease protein
MSLLAAAGPIIPQFGGAPANYACERRNPLFCWDWLSRNWSAVVWPALRQHIVLTLIAVAIGFVIAMTLALLAYRYRRLDAPITAVTTVLYTIPSIALFELLVPPFGLNRTTAEIALVSYTLLILFRNTTTGLREVPAEVRDAAAGMGMTRNQSLLRVELPLALPAIIAGLRIATVTVISLATIAYLVGAGGLGAPINDAISGGPFKTELIVAGGLAVLLALFADALLVVVQRLLTPWARRGI